MPRALTSRVWAAFSWLPSLAYDTDTGSRSAKRRVARLLSCVVSAMPPPEVCCMACCRGGVKLYLRAVLQAEFGRRTALKYSLTPPRQHAMLQTSGGGMAETTQDNKRATRRFALRLPVS